MKFVLNSPGHLAANLIQIILAIHLFFILESMQYINQKFRFSLNQPFRPRYNSKFFHDYDYPWFIKWPRPGPISKLAARKSPGPEMASLNSDDPVIRQMDSNKETNSAETVIDKIEEPVDPLTAPDKLEIDRGVAVNFKTAIENSSPLLARFILKNCGRSKNLGKRIVNGEDAEVGAYPWMVSILKYGDPWCGGTIMNMRWIITAGHCLMSTLDPKAYAARVGSVNRNAGTTYKIVKLIIHERFHLDNMFNSDIALLKVDRPIKFGDNVNSVCLPRNLFEEPKTTSLIVVGWGAQNSGDQDMPVNLQEVTLDRISDGSCARKYQAKSSVIYKSQICTWTKGKDACQGDSGGPAIEIQNSRAVLIGIVSYGSRCATQYPGVYTQVSYFLTWIKTQLEKR